MATIYFDTNVLLNMYSYPFELMEEVLEIIENYFDIVIPAQTRIEFDRHHSRQIKHAQANNAFSAETSRVTAIFSEIEKKIDSLSEAFVYSHSSSCLPSRVTALKKSIDENKTLIFQEISSLKSQFVFGYDKTDIVLAFVDNHPTSFVLNGETKRSLSAQYISRVTLGIKPGITDFQKTKRDGQYDACGDYFVWYEILQHLDGDEEVIFLTDEQKCDWWMDGNPGKLDSFLAEEYAEDNPSTQLTVQSFISFLTSLVSGGYSMSPELRAFIAGEQENYESLFKRFEFLLPLESEIEYELNSLWAIPKFDFFLSGEVTRTEEICINDVTIITAPSDIRYEHGSFSDAFEIMYQVKARGTLNIEIQIGGRDGYSEWYSHIPFEATLELKTTYSLDWPRMEFESLDGLEVLAFKADEQAAEKQYELEEDEPGKYGNCPDCGAPINDDNYSVSSFCADCAKNH